MPIDTGPTGWKKYADQALGFVAGIPQGILGQAPTGNMPTDMGQLSGILGSLGLSALSKLRTPSIPSQMPSQQMTAPAGRMIGGAAPEMIPSMGAEFAPATAEGESLWNNYRALQQAEDKFRLQELARQGTPPGKINYGGLIGENVDPLAMSRKVQAAKEARRIKEGIPASPPRMR